MWVVFNLGPDCAFWCSALVLCLDLNYIVSMIKRHTSCIYAHTCMCTYWHAHIDMWVLTCIYWHTPIHKISTYNIMCICILGIHVNLSCMYIWKNAMQVTVEQPVSKSAPNAKPRSWLLMGAGGLWELRPYWVRILPHQHKITMFHSCETLVNEQHMNLSDFHTCTLKSKMKITNNYWMRLSMISWIIKTEVSVICRSWRLRQITQTGGFDNSWYHAKTEFNNCFTTHFSHNSSSQTEAKHSAILFLRRTLQGA